MAQGRNQNGRTFKHKSLRRPDHAVDDRAVQKLPARTDHHPAEPGEPATLVQHLEEAFYILGVRHRNIDVHAVRAGKLFAGVLAVKPGAGRVPDHAADAGQGGQHFYRRAR